MRLVDHEQGSQFLRVTSPRPLRSRSNLKSEAYRERPKSEGRSIKGEGEGRGSGGGQRGGG